MYKVQVLLHTTLLLHCLPQSITVYFSVQLVAHTSSLFTGTWYWIELWLCHSNGCPAHNSLLLQDQKLFHGSMVRCACFSNSLPGSLTLQKLWVVVLQFRSGRTQHTDVTLGGELVSICSRLFSQYPQLEEHVLLNLCVKSWKILTMII
jgi:hypothetical protein